MNLVVNKKGFLAVVFSFIFSIILVLMPWNEWRSTEYLDRSNYINYIDESLNKIYWFNYDSFLLKLTHEWLWHEGLNFSTEVLGLTSTEILFFISFLIVFVSSVFLSKRYGYASLTLLLTPVYIDFMYSQLRLGFAISILFIAYYLFRRYKFLAILLALVTPFIHTSAVIFISIFFFSLFLENSKVIQPRFKAFLSILTGLSFGLLTGPFLSSVLTTIGDRRAEDYPDMSSSMAYMSFWIVFFAYLVVKGLFENKNRLFSFYLSLTILGIVSIQTILGGYPSRYLVAFFPFLLGTMIETKAKEQPIIILCYVGYTAFLWLYWLNN